MLKPNPAFQNSLKQLLADLEKRRPQGRAIAAFDADGTLWDTDLGEALFNYEIKHKLVPLPKDPWAHYHGLKETASRTAAYLWLAQINKGVPIAQVREWAKAAVDEMRPLPVFPEQKQIIQRLHELDVEVYIVTASITWAIEPAASEFHIPTNCVLGIETEIVNGTVTDKQKGVITFRKGKAEALLAATGGIAPYFCAGNTEGDFFLLEASTDLRLVVAAAREDNENYPTEQRMAALARQNSWYLYQ